MYRGSDTSAKTRIGQLISCAEPFFGPSMGRTTGRKIVAPCLTKCLLFSRSLGDGLSLL
jgi:hypothetical protein